MKQAGLEKIVEKPKEVWIVRHRLPDEQEATIVEEFDTKKEMEDWIDSTGKALTDEYGGKIEFDCGPSELEKKDEMG